MITQLIWITLTSISGVRERSLNLITHLPRYFNFRGENDTQLGNAHTEQSFVYHQQVISLVRVAAPSVHLTILLTHTQTNIYIYIYIRTISLFYSYQNRRASSRKYRKCVWQIKYVCKILWELVIYFREYCQLETTKIIKTRELII